MKKLFLLINCTLFACNIMSQTITDGTKVTLEYDPSKQDKNIIRFHYFRAALNGDATISYERYLLKYTSIEFGAGITYSSIVDLAYYRIFDIEYPSFHQLKRKISYSFMTGVRIYLKKEFMEGLYLNPFYRQLNYKFRNSDSDSYTKYNILLNDLGLSIGYNQFFGNAHFDFFTGIGMRHAHVNTEFDRYPKDMGKINQNKVFPLLLMGVRFGMSF